ncbi:glycosyltransferase [Microbacterium sp. NPDC089320]|uniref:glycosyltransferase n=1 Tax=Microbacterium sp. NPDC089320 TaxID=3155182 RepID=UPI00343C79C9
MPTAPRVSIVIPLFDDAETVAAALESCLGQTLAEVEIICIDDASTDGTGDVVERFRERDSRIRLLRQPRNLTALQARRVGVIEATAPYVLFLDGDDELHPDAAQKALTAATRHGADMLGFSAEVVTPDGRIVGGYQKRLAPQHTALSGSGVLNGLFPSGAPAQGQLWRFLFRTSLLRNAYELLPTDLQLPRVNDLPLLFLVAALADSYASINDRLYRYHYGRGGSGQAVETLDQVHFYADAIRSIDSIRPAVHSIARTRSNPGLLLDAYDSARMSIIGHVLSHLLTHTAPHLTGDVLAHLNTCAPPVDLVLAAALFHPETLSVLKRHSAPIELGDAPVHSVMLTTRSLKTGGVSNVLLAQAAYLRQAGYRVLIVARRFDSNRSLVPEGVEFVEMVGRGLPERLMEWAAICRSRSVDVIIDHQVMYSRDWPEYALTARALGVATIGWLHSFAGRPTYDGNGTHGLLKECLPLLSTTVTLSLLDVAFWKLRGVERTVYLPNPPSPLMLESRGEAIARSLPDGRIELIWCGRLDDHTKRVSDLIEVAEELRTLSLDFHITVIGPDGGDLTADRFNERARVRHLDGFIEAVGEKRGQDLIDALDGAHAFVTTSVIEGYQLTIAEAQARGLPVFMYELPWLTVVQGNDGVVSTPQGDAARLARQIAEVFGCAERYERLAAASLVAAARARSHDFADLYGRLITGSLPSRHSPLPTLEEAQALLNWTIFYADQHTARGTDSTPRQRDEGHARRGRIAKGSGGHGSSFRRRVWETAQPVGRTLLQVVPAFRPLAQRAKAMMTAGH